MTIEIDCDLLARSALGQELERGECEVLATVMGVRKLKAGEVLVNEGDKDTTLFVLVDGQLSVVGTTNGKESSIYKMKPGEVAGTRFRRPCSPQSDPQGHE